jgi:integrase
MGIMKTLMPQDQTFSSAISEFIKEKSSVVMQSTLDADYKQFEKWVADSPFSDLNDGRKLLVWILQQDKSRSRIKMAHLLRCFYKWAASEGVGLLPFNPVASFQMPKASPLQKENTVIAVKELPLVIAALERRNKKLPQWDLYAQFMLQTGMRTGEVRSLKVDDIDGSRIRVHSTYSDKHGYQPVTKTKKTRWVPLNATALNVIERIKPEDGYLFPYSLSTFMGFFSRRMDVLVEAKAIKQRYRPYDLRHTAISMWLEAGVPVAQAASWAGNTAQVIWAHYAGSTQDYKMPVL